MSTQTLQVVIQAIDKASGTLKSVGSSMTDLGNKMRGASLVVGAGLGFAVNSGVEFSEKMANVKAVSGATTDEFAKLEEQAMSLGATTRFSAKEAADAQTFLAMAGNDVNQIFDAMPNTLRLAASANLGMGDSADIVTNIMAGFGMEADELSGAVDVLAKAFTSSNTDLSQLGQAMKYVGPVASATGTSFEETAAAVGLLGNAGIQADMAGTSLRSSITRLLTPSEQVGMTMKRLGLEVTDASGNFVGFTKIVKQLEKSAASAADMMTIFGQRAGPAMLALVEQGSGALEDFTKTLEDAGGTAEQIASTQMEGLHGEFTLAKSAMETASIAITYALAPALAELATMLQSVASWFANLDGGTQTVISSILALVVVGSPLLIMLGMVTSAISTLGTALIFLATNPIGLTIVAIGALITAGIGLYTHWEEVSQWLTDLWNNLKDVFSKAVENIKSSIQKLFKPISDFYEKHKNAIVGIAGFITGLYLPTLVTMTTQTIAKMATISASWLAMSAKAIWTATITEIQVIPNIIKNLGILTARMAITAYKVVSNWVLIGTQSLIQAARIASAWFIALGPVGWVSAVVVALTALIIANWETVKAKTSEIWEATVAILSGWWESIKGFFSAGSEIINTAWGDMWGAISTTTTAFIEPIKESVQEMIDWITEKIEWVTNKMQSVKNSITGLIDDAQTSLSETSLIQNLAGVGDYVAPVVSYHANGGIVPQYLASGGISWEPRGTDTVPAMLTPGEVVLNAAQQRNVASNLKSGTNVTVNFGDVHISKEVDADNFFQQFERKLARAVQLNQLGSIRA